MTTGVGTIANRYEIQQPLGRGAFGHTYRAKDLTMQRDVAVKILDSREAVDHKVIELFGREAEVLRSMRHQGIPEIHDVIRAAWNGADATLIVMEYVEGESLARIIETRRSLAANEVMHLFLEMLGILEYIHGRVPPVIHRDIKPSNIIVRPNGSPALVDFGSARNVFRGPDETGSTVAGTYGYMPYEQYMGQATPASDLFSLGATFLHLATGRPPRDFMNSDGRIVVPASLPGDERLGPILERLLQHSPGARFQSARDARRALLSTVATPSSVPAPLARRPLPARTPSVFALGGSGMAITIGSGPVDERLDRLAPGALTMMSAGEDMEDRSAILDGLILLFFSVITAGVLPITYIGMAASRRRRVQHFLTHGRPTVARIDKISTHKAPFDVPMAKVRFEFEADGRTHRAFDIIMPERAERWRDGEDVQVLYDPDRGYAAIIVT